MHLIYLPSSSQRKKSLFYIFVSTAAKPDLPCYSVQLFPLAFKKGVSWICKVTEMQHRNYESVTSIANTHYLDTLTQITLKDPRMAFNF